MGNLERENESLLIATQNDAIKLIIPKQKLIIHKIARVDCVETNMNQSITFIINANFHERNTRVYMTGRKIDSLDTVLEGKI